MRTVAQTLAVIAFAASFVVVAVIAISNANSTAQRVAASQEQINSILTRSCQDNGNPLRMAVQQMLRDQIEQSHSAQLERFFPQIPPKQLHKLIREANQKRRQEIRTIAPVDCEALYHR